jgi:polysaccharide pyruvyl transferase WcaK-like protein
MGSLKNKGNSSILNGTINVLGRFYPNASITVLTHGPRDELKSFKVRALPAICGVPTGSTLTKIPKTILCLLKLSYAMFLASIWSGIRGCLGLEIDILTRYSTLHEYVAADVVVVRGADTLTDRYGKIGLDGLCMRFFSIFVAVLLKKPTVICGHSIGPFKIRIGKIIARFVLNRVSLITVRENLSRNVLQKMGVKNPNIYETADLAFCMRPSSLERAKKILLIEGIRRNRPIVGVSVSRLITFYIPSKSRGRSYAKYVEFMAKLVDAIIDKFDVTVVFVPHVTGPGETYDDRLVSEDIYKLTRNQDKIRLIKGDYSAEELRRIIGLCEIFIGSRTHAAISAISMHVPSIALSYLPKTDGILRMANQEKWILGVQSLDYKEAEAKVVHLWRNRDKIRKSLAAEMKKLREKAFSNGRLVKELLEAYDRR